jgi:hypothetical protein
MHRRREHYGAGDIPPAEAEDRYYAMLDERMLAAQLKPNGLRQTRGGSNPVRFSDWPKKMLAMEP